MIQNFANGLDFRRSHDTAPPGSLRTLTNAFINSGGEIEKRKSWTIEPVVTAYGQLANYKTLISGPHPVPTSISDVYFRHRHNSRPTAPWTNGAGSVAAYVDIAGGSRVWAVTSTTAATDFQALMRGQAAMEFGTASILIEGYLSNPDPAAGFVHFKTFEITFTALEPTLTVPVAANDGRFMGAILKEKLYIVGGTATLWFSAVGDPSDMAGVGSGSIVASTQGSAIGALMSIGVYYDQLAVFGRKGVQFWSVAADPDENQYLRSLGAFMMAPRSVEGYGSGDLFFLSRTGVRSLQARDSSNLADVGDVGSPIDDQIKADLIAASAVSETTGGVSRFLRADSWLANSIVLPDSGQYWLFLHEKVYVLSVHLEAKVRAWSVFELPTVTPANVSAVNGALKSRWCADACPLWGSVMFRNFADEVYLYGGYGGNTYDAAEVTVVTPHMDMGRPGTEKMFTGIDLACVGAWTVEVSLDPANIVWEAIATITNSSFRLTGVIPFEMTGTHIALRMKTTSASAAKIGQVVIYYKGGDDK